MFSCLPHQIQIPLASQLKRGTLTEFSPLFKAGALVLALFDRGGSECEQAGRSPELGGMFGARKHALGG
jgi:hypothetical protein